MKTLKESILSSSGAGSRVYIEEWCKKNFPDEYIFWQVNDKNEIVLSGAGYTIELHDNIPNVIKFSVASSCKNNDIIICDDVELSQDDIDRFPKNVSSITFKGDIKLATPIKIECKYLTFNLVKQKINKKITAKCNNLELLYSTIDILKNVDYCRLDGKPLACLELYCDDGNEIYKFITDRKNRVRRAKCGLDKSGNFDLKDIDTNISDEAVNKIRTICKKYNIDLDDLDYLYYDNRELIARGRVLKSFWYNEDDGDNRLYRIRF